MFVTYDATIPEDDTRLKASPVRPDEMDAAAFARTRLGLVPDLKQAAVLQSDAQRGILNCSRQWGKSTVAAAKAVHRAFTRPECLVLVASPSERQSALFMRNAAQMVGALGIRPRGDGDNPISLLLPNRSRIVGLPGTEATVRGFSAVSMILIDEAARVADEMYIALRPMLAVGGGDMWLMSTPNGQRGFFHEAWMSETGEWMRVSAKATECERISAEFLDRERGAIGSSAFAQEYMCEFHGDGTEYFDRQTLADAVDETVTELKIPGRKCD